METGMKRFTVASYVESLKVAPGSIYVHPKVHVDLHMPSAASAHGLSANATFGQDQMQLGLTCRLSAVAVTWDRTRPRVAKVTGLSLLRAAARRPAACSSSTLAFSRSASAAWLGPCGCTCRQNTGCPCCTEPGVWMVKVSCRKGVDTAVAGWVTNLRSGLGRGSLALARAWVLRMREVGGQAQTMQLNTPLHPACCWDCSYMWSQAGLADCQCPDKPPAHLPSAPMMVHPFIRRLT